MSFVAKVAEAKKIATAMGTWPFHDLLAAASREEFVGFLRFATVGLEREHAACTEEIEATKSKRRIKSLVAKQKKIRSTIGQWRRTTRWVLSVDDEQAESVAKAVLRQVRGEAFYVECGHPYYTEEDEAPRPSGRPRVRASATVHRECTGCHGLGYV